MDACKKEKINAYKRTKAIGGVYVIRCDTAGKQLLLSSTNLQGSKNQFTFSQLTGSCVKPAVQADWNSHGPQAFTFEVLEELEQGENQTVAELKEDIAVLEELWREKLPQDSLY